jgi:hypothetical protein
MSCVSEYHMFVLRLMIVAVGAVMLLPLEAPRDQTDGRQASAQNFCQRYPKTCDASGELWSVFKLKLAYGVKLARQELAAQSSTPQRAYGIPKLTGRLNEWRPQDVGPRYSGYSGGTLSPSERASDWPRNP